MRGRREGKCELGAFDGLFVLQLSRVLANAGGSYQVHDGDELLLVVLLDGPLFLLLRLGLLVSGGLTS